MLHDMQMYVIVALFDTLENCSTARCPGFKSLSRRQQKSISPYRIVVSMGDSQSSGPGSIPGGGTRETTE